MTGKTSQKLVPEEHVRSADDDRLHATERRFRILLLTVLAIGILAWSIFAWMVAPRLLSNAYAGRGPSALVNALEYRHSYPLQHYLAKWNGIALTVLVAWLAAGVLTVITTSGVFGRRFAGTATPGTLGAMRILICATLAFATYALPLREMAGLPDAQRISMGIMDLFYAARWDYVVHSSALVEALKWLCIVLCLIGAIGYQTRRTLPCVAVLYLLLAGIPRSYFWFNHSGLIPWYCLVVLCVSRSGEGYSLDRLLKSRRGKCTARADVATAHYGWARLAIWLCICIPYALAGLSKLRFGNWQWWNATNMQYVLFNQALNHSDTRTILALLAVPSWCFAVAGLATVFTEIGMMSVPFFRWPRLALPITMFCMHAITGLVMGVNFYDLMVLQAVFYDWTPLWRSVSRYRSMHTIARVTGTADTSVDARPKPVGAARALAAPIGIAFLVWLLIGVWCLRLERYPLTSMQMFSNYADTTLVDYYRAYVTYADGTTELARFANMGGGVEQYEPVLEWAFRHDKGRQACMYLMARSARWWNANHVDPSRRIVGFETQHGQWDINQARADPATAGTIVDVLRLDVDAAERDSPPALHAQE